ncbi:MAG TPA: amidohydrolase family protein [Chloroflexota bacterium]|nr:amidohydrolase family protein [Chloroflexota bacterium]
MPPAGVDAPIVIDVDSHFLPSDAFDDEAGKRRFRSRWPRFMMDSLGRDWVAFPERWEMLNPHQRSLPCAMIPGKHHPGYYDSTARAGWLDEAGFDMQVLVPSPSPFTYDLDPDLGLAVCRSYNDAVGRALRRNPGRFIGLALLPMQDPVAAVEELERAVVELGIQAPLVISNVNGRNLDDYRFWPVYERIEQLGVPLIIHGNRFGPLLGLERLPHMHLDNSLGFLFEGTVAITSLIMNGVLDMYPRLRVGVLETGAGYISYLMDRLQAVYEDETLGGISPNAARRVKDLIRKPPEEYMDHIWMCFDLGSERRSIPGVVERFGAGRFMINSDFPHNIGGGGKGAVALLDGIGQLTSAQKAQLLGLSACALFGIDPATREQRRAAGQQAVADKIAVPA